MVHVEHMDNGRFSEIVMTGNQIKDSHKDGRAVRSQLQTKTNKCKWQDNILKKREEEKMFNTYELSKT